MRYKVSYNYIDLAEVEIEDSARAIAAIKEMVEFWVYGLERVEEDKDFDDDVNQAYRNVFMKDLGKFIIKNGHRPGRFGGDEGWVPLDGEHGIWVRNVDPLDPDDDEFEITSL